MPVPIEKIEPADDLYRRVIGFAIQDGTVTSAAYKGGGKPDPEPSVDLARITTVQRCFDFGGISGVAIGVLKAQTPISLDLPVEHVPDINPAHCVIRGKHTKETCRRLAEATTILVKVGELVLSRRD